VQPVLQNTPMDRRAWLLNPVNMCACCASTGNMVNRSFAVWVMVDLFGNVTRMGCLVGSSSVHAVSRSR
jgi:hypothetical protein